MKIVLTFGKVGRHHAATFGDERAARLLEVLDADLRDDAAHPRRKGAEHREPEADRRVDLHEQALVGLTIDNDSWVDEGKTASRLTEPQFEANLRELVRRLRDEAPLLHPELGEEECQTAIDAADEDARAMASEASARRTAERRMGVVARG